MRIPIWKATLLSIIFVTMFPSLWAMASERLYMNDQNFGYRRLDPPGQIRAAGVVSPETPNSLIRSVVSRPSSSASPQQFPFITALSLMSLGVVGLVAIRRRD